MGNYLPSTADERAAMLEAIGCASIDELYTDVPTSTVVDHLDIPAGKSELEVRRAIEGMAAKNTVFPTIFRGAGAYSRFIPAIVDSVLAKEAFITSYTPYQAEISQGVLQSIFEYQTMVCELLGMDVSNASLYDGASAAAEAVLMCQERKRTRVVVSGAANPQFIETIRTYAHSRGVPVEVIPPAAGATNTEAAVRALGDDAACLFFQQPNYFGVLEDARALVEAAHTAGAKAIMGVEPTSLGLLQPPGEAGADIAIAEGQPLGLPLTFGGPYLGIIACTDALKRKLPGRIVGQTTDEAGRRAFVLTLQAREQHIRREKASSNVCSNEALCALAAGAYLAAMGPGGIEQVAALSLDKAHYAAERICALPGFDLVYDRPFFNEFVTTCPGDPSALEAALAHKGILSGLPLAADEAPGLPAEGGILWCCTELNAREDIDRLVAVLAEATGAPAGNTTADGTIAPDNNSTAEVA